MNNKINTKTPISYYGGKQSMLNVILPLIPEHHTYYEPFAGGAAVFFAKQASKVEIINDMNCFVGAFYKQVKSNIEALKLIIDGTLYSRTVYKKCMAIYSFPELFNDLYKAWAFFVLTNQGFNGSIGGWSYGVKSATGLKAFAVKKQLLLAAAKRLENAQIESKDALKVIQSCNRVNSFGYIDPPYFQANMGHYGGYTEQHFDDLLGELSVSKGKFLLSSYDSGLLDNYVKRNGWYQKRIKSKLAPSSKKKIKVEVLTANYPI